MGRQSRRNFLKQSLAISGTLTLGKKDSLQAGPKKILSEDRMGVLVDTTVCVGCRRCEYACKKAHNLPTPDLETYADRSVFDTMRRPDVDALTVVNEFENKKDPDIPYTVKVQCMHCNEPACVSACIVGAFSKEENGAVIWDTDKCIGCRYCIVACPFQVPTFEFHKALNPEIKKCDFCYERTQQGQIPACVEICPVEALTYGRFYDLHKLAHDKIEEDPDRYINHIYGDSEVGGTSWIYLAGAEFEDLGFPKLGNNPAPGVSEAIQHGVFAYFIPPISFYALLGGVMWLTKNNKKSD
jgi:formate dehydrogenase iron-sulfur subunit